MPDSKLNDDRMDQLKALYQEFLNPGFVKNRIKWCKKQREHDGLDEGKCYFHFVDLGDDGKQGLSAVGTRRVSPAA